MIEYFLILKLKHNISFFLVIVWGVCTFLNLFEIVKASGKNKNLPLPSYFYHYKGEGDTPVPPSFAQGDLCMKQVPIQLSKDKLQPVKLDVIPCLLGLTNLPNKRLVEQGSMDV